MSQEKITRFRRRFDSLYWQQFLLTAGMVLLTLLLLGVSFYALSYNDTVSERRSEMRQHAELIANMSGDYLASGGQTASPSLQNLIALAAGLTKADFLLCNDQGYALLTSDQRLGGQVVSVPQSKMRITYSQYSSSVSPFTANTGMPRAAMAAAAWSCVEKMLHEAQRMSAPSSASVSISTAVWIVMCSDPVMRAPVSGFVTPNSLRSAIRPGISVSAISISLRP